MTNERKKRLRLRLCVLYLKRCKTWLIRKRSSRDRKWLTRLCWKICAQLYDKKKEERCWALLSLSSAPRVAWLFRKSVLKVTRESTLSSDSCKASTSFLDTKQATFFLNCQVSFSCTRGLRLQLIFFCPCKVEVFKRKENIYGTDSRRDCRFDSTSGV